MRATATLKVLLLALLSITYGGSAFAARLRNDGLPDLRYKQNRHVPSYQAPSYQAPSYQAPSYQPSAQPTYNPAPTQHLRNDGQPDMRFRDNRVSPSGSPAYQAPSYQAPSYQPSNQPTQNSFNPAPAVHLRKDGQPDMRYKDNQFAAPTQSNNPNVKRYGSDPVPQQQPTYNTAPTNSAPARSDRVHTATPQSQWQQLSNGRYLDPVTGRSLNNDGTYDLRSNKDLKGVTQNSAGRPTTSTPANQWITDSKGRYVDPNSGRPLNRDGTFDMRRAQNKDLSNVGARVLFGADNSYQAQQRQSQVRSRDQNVINNYYNNINNTYVNSDFGYGSWGYQNRYYGGIIWGSPVDAYCMINCGWYTPDFWNPWIDTYNYYPSYYYAYRPMVLSDSDIAFGLVSWLFVNAAIDADNQSRQYYQEALPGVAQVRPFTYSQDFLPTEDFVALAKDISGADSSIVQNFMSGLENMTSVLEQKIRVGMNNPSFTIQKHDIDVRLAENHGNMLVLLKGHIDRRDASGSTYLARADFTGTIDLRSGAARVFVMSAGNDGLANPSADELAVMQSINAQVSQVDASLDAQNAPVQQQVQAQPAPTYRAEPAPATNRNW